MLRLILLPFYLVFGLIGAIITLPLSLFHSKKLMDIEKDAKQNLKDIEDNLNKELGCRVCPFCLQDKYLRVSPAPERKVSTQNSNCTLCWGTGHLTGVNK